jgi:catechol-2,3-dioxygenase
MTPLVPRVAAPDPVDPGIRLGHVHLRTADIDQIRDFYVDVLGFDVISEVRDVPGWGTTGDALFLSAGGYHHHLGTNTWAAGAALAGENDARLLEWEIVLPEAEDVRAAGSSLEQAGASVESTGGTAAAADPWGTRLRLRTA